MGKIDNNGFDHLKTGQRVDKEKDEYIPVNKGHFEMDSDERIMAFHQILGKGWESKYKEYREAWQVLPSNKIIRDYPVIVDLELSSACNLKCPMCYTITDKFKDTVNAQLMDYELYKKIVDEIAGKVYGIRLSWRGESTLHKKFIEAIRYAKGKGIQEISFLTSGWNLTLDYFKELSDAGADWVTVSFDGLGEEYNKIRKPLTCEGTLKNLQDIQDYKNSSGVTKPVIKVQGIWPAIRKDPEKFYNTLSKVSDLVAFNPIIDYLENDSDIVYEENFSCPQLYERVFVSASGDVLMCNSDESGEEVIGNAYKETIHQIWHGKRLNEFREIHKRKDGFKEVPVCLKCFFPRKTEVNEKAIVNGKEIHIENYINRPQEVGK